MKLFVFTLLFLITYTSWGQTIPVNSTWSLTGSSASFLETQSVENVELFFLQNDVIEIHYDYSSVPTTETSTWAQIDANNFKMSFDPSGDFFGANCPDDTMFVQYDIVSNSLTMNTISGNCTLAGPVLTGSVWMNQDLTSVNSISEVNFLLFPNPAKNHFSVHGQFTTNISFSVYNSLGEVMDCDVHQKNSETYEISTENLKTGIYFLEMLEENKFGKSIPLIVE